MSKSQYLYATGRIRSLENKLLSPNDIERMIDAKDAQTVFKVFNDLSYADELADIESEEEYKEVLDHDLLQVKNTLRQIVPQKEILNLLFLGYDFHNVKLFFKSKYIEKDLSDFESHLGNIDVAKLKDFIFKETKTAIPKEVEDVIKEAKHLFEKEADGYIIDSYFDREFLKILKKVSARVRNKFISNLISTWIDVANVKFFL
jgi:V/A-type H+-transporting ATPase subunit C